MIKKIVCIVAAACILAGTVFAADNSFSINPDGKFITYTSGGDIKPVSKIMNINENDFKSECDNKNIIYFAVNSSKTKQIQVTCSETGFSNSIVNLSNLADENIHTLMSDFTGDAAIKGIIIEKDGQKFIKALLSSSDSGGKYTVTEYLTVAGKKFYTLSFFTASEADSDYIEKTFYTFDAEDFYKADKNDNLTKYLIFGGIIIFTLASIIIIYTLIRDIRKPEDNQQL